MGPIPPANSDATPVGSNNGSTMNLDGGGPSHWQEQLAPMDAEATLQDEVQNVVDAGDVHVGLMQATRTEARPIIALEKFPVLEAVQAPTPA